MRAEKQKAPEGDAKKVTFAEDVKPAATENVEAEQGPVPVDGVIGQLEIHRSGAVKMRLANGIVMDVRFPVLTL